MGRIALSFAIVLAAFWMSPPEAYPCGVKLAVKSARVRRPAKATSEREPIAVGPTEEQRTPTAGGSSGTEGRAPHRAGGRETRQARTTPPKRQEEPKAVEEKPVEETPVEEKKPTDIGDRSESGDKPPRGDTGTPPREGPSARFAKRVFFANGSVALSASAKAKLRQDAKWMQQNPSRSITVEGHANTLGNPDANRELSEKRAAAVKDYLVEQGVDESRITTQGYGSERPEFQPGSSGKNRRVVLVAN